MATTSFASVVLRLCFLGYFAVSALGSIVEDDFGTFFDERASETRAVRRFTLTNRNNVSVQIISYGATVTTVLVPDKHGKLADVNLGFDSMDGYIENIADPHIGAIIGRVANRVGKAQFTIDGKTFHVSKNAGQNHLHGGFRGFDKRVWEADVSKNKVTFSYVSLDGEEGYPGHVTTHVTYSLNDENELSVEMIATATKPTPINLTNHAYLNLAGHGSGSSGLYEHIVSINADAITPAIDTIPTGEIKAVNGTVYDLRQARLLREAIQQTPEGGFDSNFCVNLVNSEKTTRVAKVVHPASGRVLEVFSDQPGVQFYTSNHFPQDDRLKGKGGVVYSKHGAFCLETQNYPDAINQITFPNSLIRPGNIYHHSVMYRFTTQE